MKKAYMSGMRSVIKLTTLTNFLRMHGIVLFFYPIYTDAILLISRGFTSLTLKATPIICSRRQLSNVAVFFLQNNKYGMMFHENRLLAHHFHEISYLNFFNKLGKMSQNLSSAAVVIGALRVKTKRAAIVCYIWYNQKRGIS